MSKKISELPEYVGADTPAGDVPISIAGTTYRISPGKIKGTSGSGATLGLIKIVDKAGDFFTNLSTASAYIRTFTSATITNESYSNGTFWFTVPNGSNVAINNGFLYKLTPHTAYIEDPLELISFLGNNTLGNSSGISVLGNVRFGTNSLVSFAGILRIRNLTLLNNSDTFGVNASGRVEIYGTIGTTTGNDYANFFPTNTAVIWARRLMQTNNGGGIEGDLARAQTNGAKLFFGYADGGATDLSYTASPTNGIVASSTGTDATIPLADNTNAGLLSPTEKSAIAEINKTQVKLSENITKGQVVYVSSANGTNIIVSKASNASEATSSKTLGLLETTGVTNDIVNVVTFELLAGLNTSTATVGDAVWLGTGGNLIYGLASKPVAPAHLVYIGVVTRVSATVGEIFINIQNGFEMNEIHDFSDVSYNPAIDTDSLMIRDITTLLWKRFTIANLKSLIRGTLLTGLDTSATTQVTATDSIVTAIGELQGQLNTKQTYLVKDSVPTSAITGTTSLTQIGSSILIPANTFSANDVIVLDSLGILKTGILGTCFFRLLQNTSDTLTGANILGSAFLTATQITGNMQRVFEINGGLLKNRIGGTTSVFTDKQGSTSAGLSVSFDPTIDNYFFRVVTLSAATDSVISTQLVILK